MQSGSLQWPKLGIEHVATMLCITWHSSAARDLETARAGTRPAKAEELGRGESGRESDFSACDRGSMDY